MSFAATRLVRPQPRPARQPSISKGPWLEAETRSFLVLGLAVFAAAALGLASSHAFSLSFWPANPVLVGLALRDRRLFRLSGWVGAGIGFMSADLLFGRTLSLALSFAGTNLVGTLAATLLLGYLPPADLALRRVRSVLNILVCLLPACFAAGVCGAVLVVVQFGGSATQALMTWPASELVNYLVVLPAMLCVSLPWQAQTTPRIRRKRGDIWPALMLLVSCAATIAFDGPGSIMFPLPALLLCALAYSIPTTALLTLILGTGCLTMMGMGYMDIGQDMSIPRMVVSVRIAVAFLVLVPLTISSAMAVRDQLLSQLRDVADHDGLTGLLNRRAFEQGMQERFAAARATGRGLVVLWLDIDHFKAINDRHGHLAGDAVLQAFAETARGCCREGDLVGRLGGEEFALVMDVSGPEAAAAVAERLRQAIASQTVEWDGMPVRATVSIGAGHVDGTRGDLPELVRLLDEALYRAKRKGRDRIEWMAAYGAPLSVVTSIDSARIAAVG